MLFLLTFLVEVYGSKSGDATATIKSLPVLVIPQAPKPAIIKNNSIRPYQYDFFTNKNVPSPE